jgi:ATP-dependent RNA helicase RhlB
LRIVDEVKKGDHKYLVATDVAARGLHINELEMVINYDVPLEAESYVHRIGRTARAGKEGKTVTMACEEYVYGLGPIEKLLGRKIPVSWADENLMVEDKSAGRRFPPQDRYREMGGGNVGDGPRRDNRDSRGQSRNDNRRPRNDRRPPDNRKPGDNRDARNDRGARDSRKPADPQRAPKNGKQPLDPRAAKIQSVVSSIAGGSMDEFGDKKESRNDKRRADARPDRSKSEKSKSERSRSDKPKKENIRKRSTAPTRKTPNDHRKNGVTEGDRVSSENSIDERLEYYRKKYGEDFKFSGAGGNSGGSRKKRKKVPAKPSKSAPEGENLKKDDSQKTDIGSKKEKKGLLGRLFKK